MLEGHASIKPSHADPSVPERLGHQEQRGSVGENRERKTGLDYLEDRILSFHQEALTLRRGLMCRPRFAVIYPTYVCNHACVGCDYTEYNQQEKPAMLSRLQLDCVLEQVVELGVRAVEFCGGGEPLLHPDIDNAIGRLRRTGIGVGLLTNGTAISRSRARHLARSCSYIRVSIEAGSEPTFLQVKRPKSASVGFAQVLENVSLLIHYRDRLKSRCQVSLKYAIDKNNMHDLEAAIRHARDLHVDSIQFKCIRNVPSELSNEQKQLLNEELSGWRVAYPGVRILGDLRPYRVKVPCWLSPLHVMIDAVGDAFACCYYRHRSEHHRYGNVFDRRLRDLWYSTDHLKTIGTIRKEECEKYDCRFIKYAEVMDNALAHGELDFL